MTVYPNSEDYVRAVQRPDASFRRPELRRAVLDVHPLWGIPVPASGNAAVVFKATVDGSPQALRFFIREDASSRERYAALGRHFRAHDLMDCVAGPVWIDAAIEVGGRSWPMVQMEWIEGRTLDAYVGHLAEHGDVHALHLLAGSWRAGVNRLQAAEFAHGDLQHANVLIDTSTALRLVDFDGSWIAAFHDGAPPNETGHPNYQRTGRTWGRWMDTFPALVIYTSLLALSRRPDGWRALHNGENMLFSHDDFAPPFTTRAWTFLSSINDPEMAHAVHRLQRLCEPGRNADGTLEALLGPERSVVVPRPRPRPAPVRVPDLDDPSLPWWVKTAPSLPPASLASSAMPLPPSKAGPQPGETVAPVFTGPGSDGSWFGQRTGEPEPAGSTGWPAAAVQPAGQGPPPSTRTSGQAALIAGGVALLTAVVVAAIVAGAGGNPAAAALVTALIAFLIVFALTSPRR